MKETVLGIQAVKVFGWERAFGERVRRARADELTHNARVQRLSAVSNAIMEAVPILCALASLASYTAFYPDSPDGVAGLCIAARLQPASYAADECAAPR